MPVVGTAGHVDHGKSTLVRALTGTDPDRLAEERRRGLTIDLGFAALGLPSGRTVGFVDVPGHERYLRNMLAGVGAVHACVLVVAADEGWMAQTEEHLRVIDLLGIGAGIVVVSKCDSVDDDVRQLAALEVEDRLAGSSLAHSPVVAADAVTGRGLGAVVAALDELLDRLPEASDTGRVRLWVDRSFAVDGAGAVVTGTLAGGSLAVGDRLEVVSPSRSRTVGVRVRGLQHHHGGVERLGPGERVAVNLTGVSHHDLRRGDAVVAPGRWFRTAVVDASVDVLDSLDHDLSRRGAYTAHIGSGELAVRLRVLGPGRVAPGSRGAVRLHLPGHLPLVPGDRYVLRESGRNETVGGGEVLDVDPVTRAVDARPDRRVERVVAERGRLTVADLELRTGRVAAPTVGRWVADPGHLARVAEALAARLRSAGVVGVDTATLDEFERDVVGTLDGVVVRDGVARDRDADAGDRAAGHPWLDRLRADPLGSPPPEDVEPATLRELRRSGRVLQIDGVWFDASSLAELVPQLASVVRSRPDGVTISDVRDALGGTRRTLVPFLTWCDEQGLTRRRGDVRIAGPRLPG